MATEVEISPRIRLPAPAELTAGGGSELRWTERLSLPLGTAGRLAWRAVRPLAQRGLDASLRRLARAQRPAG